MTIMTVLHLIACGFIAGAGRAAQLYFFPYAKCQWCKNKKPGTSCWRCHGHRRVRRWGARYIHRGRLAATDAWNERRQGL